MKTATKVVGGMLFLAAMTAGSLKLIATDPPLPENRSIASAPLRNICPWGGGTPFSDAPPYSGPAPHPIVIADSGLSEDSSLPPAWRPSRTQIQLIGCVDSTTNGNPIGSCDFDYPSRRTVTIVETTSSVTLYEARTGRRIGNATVPSGTFTCPDRTLVFDNDRPLQASPGYEEYAKALSQYVEK